MKEKKMLIILLVVCGIVTILWCFKSNTKDNKDYSQIFKQNYNLFSEISMELIEIDYECSIEQKPNGELIVSDYQVELYISSKPEFKSKISNLFSQGEVLGINVEKGYVKFDLKKPPKNYRGWYVYNPKGTFWGGAEGFTEIIAENWILEILPNT